LFHARDSLNIPSFLTHELFQYNISTFRYFYDNLSRSWPYSVLYMYHWKKLSATYRWKDSVSVSLIQFYLRCSVCFSQKIEKEWNSAPTLLSRTFVISNPFPSPLEVRDNGIACTVVSLLPVVNSWVDSPSMRLAGIGSRLAT